jgi:unsaturated rhamnogalacturonyl hydrolase
MSTVRFNHNQLFKHFNPMKKKTLIPLFLLLIFGLLPAKAQNKKEQANDFNTPLHLLDPDYNIPYGVPKTETIKKDLDRILAYLWDVTPATLINNRTGEEIKSPFFNLLCRSI